MSEITNLTKEDKMGRPLVWRFEYDGIQTEAVEAEWDDDKNMQAVDIIMQTPNGRFSQKVFVSAEMITLYESHALRMAAEKCLREYKKQDKKNTQNGKR